MDYFRNYLRVTQGQLLMILAFAILFFQFCNCFLAMLFLVLARLKNLTLIFSNPIDIHQSSDGESALCRSSGNSHCGLPGEPQGGDGAGNETIPADGHGSLPDS